MTAPAEPWTCTRCLMSFKIRAVRNAEIHRCPECGRTFWSGKSWANEKVTVGMESRPS